MQLNRMLLNPDGGAEGGATGAGQGVFNEQQAGNQSAGAAGGTEAAGQGTGQTGAGTSGQDTGGGAGAGTGGSGGTAGTQPITADVLAQALKLAGVGATTQVVQPQQTQQQPQVSEEEFNRIFNVFKPTSAHLAALKKAISEGDEASGLQVLTEITHGSARQAATISAYQLQQVRRELVEAMAPALALANERVEQQLATDFFGVHKDLKPFEPLVLEIAGRLKSSGFNGSKDEAFKVVSERAREILKTVAGQQAQGGGAGSGQAQGGNNHSSKMSTLSGGGQGGSGSGQGGGGKSPAMAVFD